MAPVVVIPHDYEELSYALRKQIILSLIHI